VTAWAIDLLELPGQQLDSGYTSDKTWCEGCLTYPASV
jgi:hypothetical protein